MKPDDKFGVVLACIGSLVVGLILMGLILSFSSGAYQAPWPAIAFGEALFVTVTSLLILKGRYKNNDLYILDFFVLLGMFCMLLPTVEGLDEYNRYIFGMLIYVVAFFMILLQCGVALGVSLGILKGENEDDHAVGPEPAIVTP